MHKDFADPRLTTWLPRHSSRGKDSGGRAGCQPGRGGENRVDGTPIVVIHPSGLIASGRGVAQTGSAFAWGAKGHEFKSRRPDHLRFDGISAHIFHGPKYSTRKRGGRFPLLLTRCGDHLPTADGSGAAARAAGFSGTGRRAREARFVRLASNDLRNGAPLRISEVGGGVGRSARAARPPRRAAVSAF